MAIEKVSSAFLTVRTSSTRLPNKCLMPFGEINVLQYLVRRAKFFEIQPIVCTTVENEDSILCEIADQESVPYFRGSAVNKLKRWHDCANFFGLEFFHTVDVDDPFFDPLEVFASINLLQNEELDIVRPSAKSSSGAASVGYSIRTKILERALEFASQDADTEMVEPYFSKIDDLKVETLPDNPNTPNNLRLTLDYIEDYWLLESVRKMVGDFPAREIVDNLFKKNPDLYKINWFRNDEWKFNQSIKSSNFGVM